LSDFGADCFEESLEMLVQGWEQESDLSTFGRMAARWDALRFLSNLLMLRDAERKNPAILEQRIERPIFICGMPRSGSTFLHRILSEDRSNTVVRCWETVYPLPMRGLSTADRRAARVDRHLGHFARLAPEMRRLHPMSARSPQECTEITGHVFASLRFDTTHRLPSYRRWLDQTGHLAAFRFHKRFLQHLQHRNGRGQWILKCPDNVFALDAIREVYPDARFVFMHRNPLEVLASVAKLTEVLRRPFARRVDRFEIGRQVSEQWELGAAKMLEAATGTDASRERIFHITFSSFARAPFDCALSLYEHFGLGMTGDLSAHLRRFVAERPKGGYGPNPGRLEDYGLDSHIEHRRYREYMAYFGA
jgi:hypothetical protein